MLRLLLLGRPDSEVWFHLSWEEGRLDLVEFGLLGSLSVQFIGGPTPKFFGGPNLRNRLRHFWHKTISK